MTIHIEQVGRRYYLVGNTYAAKDAIKAAGCNWDADRKQWWTGKAETAERIKDKLASVSSETAKSDSHDDTRVLGRVEYKGRNYYVIATTRDEARHKLTVLDGSISFWADATACRWIKRYQVRERTWRGHTHTEYTTLGSLRRFVADAKRDEQRKREGTAETKRCWECGCEFTALDARRNDGDWSDSYCGC